jgi:hypothetical protein
MYSNTLLLGFSILTGALAADQIVTMYLPDNDDAQALAGRILGSVRHLPPAYVPWYTRSGLCSRLTSALSNPTPRHI